MKICMVGWYYNAELIELMEIINKYHKVDIVAHRDGKHGSLDSILVENIGLEFHCYNTYINNIWDGESDILFMHDDIEMGPVVVNYEIIPPINIFNKISNLNIDQGYIFHDEADAHWNDYKHGRMIFMSGSLIKHIKNNFGGIWFDSTNTGFTIKGPYNAGIINFNETMLKLQDNYDTCNIVYCPSIVQLRRNGGVSQSLNAKVKEIRNEWNCEADGIR
jgi:hypothetical protein